MWDGIPLTNLTASTLLGLTVLLLLLGKIVPRSTYKDKADESEKWRLAYEAQRKISETSAEQTAELIELAKTSHSMLVALFNVAEPKQEPGRTHVVPTK